MPIRYESPSLGGRGESYLEAKDWQLGVSYRRLIADDFFVGRDERPELGPGGEPLHFNVNSVTLTATYALSDRVSITANVPWSTGTSSRRYADGQRHTTQASGVGDVNAVGTVWLRDPMYVPRGNVAFGIGLKAPTGSFRSRDDFWLADGSTRSEPVDQAIQLGDGGWGIILQGEAFHRMAGGAFAYLAGQYVASTRGTTGVASPRPDLLLAVADVYNVRLGVASPLWVSRGAFGSLGLRQDATTRRDIFGGRDMHFRRPAIVRYLDPAVSVSRGPHTFSVNVPIRVYQDFRNNYAFEAEDRQLGGDLAKYLLITGYSRRW